jgi:FkbM family methyltransferase
MKKVLSAFTWIASKVIGRRNLESLLIYAAKSMNINLHVHGLVQIGGLSGYYQQIIGEQFFIEKILPDLFEKESKPVFFDVGANVGDYSLALRKTFPNAAIYSFEPVKDTFDTLSKNTGAHHIDLYNIGFGDKAGTGIIYNTVNNINTEIASLYKDVFSDLFKSDDTISTTEFQMDTIDNFCYQRNISKIDFLKIDVEGHELSILNGASNLLLNNHVKVIQFEFNSHNVYSRVFLRDFYSILKDFELYRLLMDGLIKLGPYNPINEIFTLQNIIGVRKDISHLINAKFLITI